MVYSDPNNTNSIVYQHTLLSYQLKTSPWNFSRAATLHLYNMADRGEKLQQLHCYHLFSDSKDTYLTKNHHENYSPKMVPTNPTGSWTIWGCPRSHDVPLWIDYFFINNWIYHMFRMHVSGNHKVEKYSRYVIWYTNEIHTPGYSQNGWSLL